MSRSFMIKITFGICTICVCLLANSFGNMPDVSETTISKEANKFMWNNLHLGMYENIPAILQKLDSAYKQDPKNMKVTAHLGFVHLWAFSERARHLMGDSISDHIPLSNRFFKEAIELNPNDPRLKGFQAATEMCEGALTKNPVLIVDGYAKGKRHIKDWPQFNKFALSFVESLQSKNSPMFNEGIKYQWEVIDECSCKELTKEKIIASPDTVLKQLITELSKTKDPLIKRACWSSWIAPHNLEGFFINFGDMLVKDGKPDEAKVIYAAAKLAPSYKEWPFKKVLEDRIRDIEQNEEIFNKPLNLINVYGTKQIFINSELSCVGCHQMSKSEYRKYGYKEPGNDIYFSKP